MRTECLLERVNRVVGAPFESLEACLRHYREVLPERVGAYHQEEVGPITHHDEPGEADRFVKKEFHLGAVVVDMSTGLDWHAAPNGDLEWNGGLVRQGYFMLLAEEYRKTGREVYAETVIGHMLDYIDRVPAFEPEGKPYLEYKKSTWRPFEVAGRAAETWPEALAKVIKSPAMTPEAWARILLATHEHAVFLRKHHWQTGNHATLEVAAVGIIAIFYREFNECDDWLAYAVAFLDRMWPELFAADGYSREMSGSYHWVAMRSYFSFFEVASRNDAAHLFPDGYAERLVLNGLAELYQDKPDGSTPISNDSSTRINRREQLERLDKTLEVPGIRYFLSGGQTGEKPRHTSYFYPDSRVGIMRSDWTADANYLYFDMGPWGDNHMNQDQLSIEVSAKGRHFLVNGGKWRYTTSDPDADWMPLAKYFKSTRSYNCVLVNGYEQVFGDAEGTMNVYPEYDYAEGFFRNGYGEEVPGRDETLFRERGLSTLMESRVHGAVHRRQIIFLKPHCWILRDTITGAGVESATQLWHYFEGTVKPLNEERTAWATDFEDSNLLLVSAGEGPVTTATHSGQMEPFIAGWHCPYYDQIRPAPELQIEKKGDGVITFHTLLLPVDGRPSEVPRFQYQDDIYTLTMNGQSWQVAAPLNGDWKRI